MLTTQITLLDDASDDSASSADYKILGGAGLKNVQFQVMGSNTSVLSVEFRGSLSEEAPDFAAASTAANPWFSIAIVNATSGSVIAGGTGVVLAANAVVGGELNLSNPPRHLTAVVTDYTSGNVTVIAEVTNNTVSSGA